MDYEGNLHIDNLKFLGMHTIAQMTVSITDFAIDLMCFSCSSSSKFHITPQAIYNSFNVDRDKHVVTNYVNSILSDFLETETTAELEGATLVSKSIIEDKILYNARIDKQIPLDSEVLLFTFFITNI